jgi:hypothetical protein
MYLFEIIAKLCSFDPFFVYFLGKNSYLIRGDGTYFESKKVKSKGRRVAKLEALARLLATAAFWVKSDRSHQHFKK